MTARAPEVPPDRTYPGFLADGFATEPLAVLPSAGVALPPELAAGSGARDLKGELERLVLDRLPAEIRILHKLAPVYGFRDWALGSDVGPSSGYLGAIVGWEGMPAPDGAIPETVGNSVETLGDNRGIRYFLFPRTLTVVRQDRLSYFAVVDAYLLDARGERAVWSGRGRAWGALPEGDLAEQILSGVVVDAVTAALADLAARLPGAEQTAEGSDFTDTNP